MKKLLIITTGVILTVATVIGIVMAQSQSQPTTADDVLEQPRLAHGRDTLKKLKTIQISSEATFYNNKNEPFGVSQQVMSIDFKSRNVKIETFQLNKLATIVLLTAKGAWAWAIGGSVAEIPADQATRLKLITMFGPYGLREDASEKRNQKRSGKKNINANSGTDAAVSSSDATAGANAKLAIAPITKTEVSGDEIEMQTTDGETMKMVINPDTKLIARQEMNSFDGHLQQYEFGDYRTVDGLKIPFEMRLTQDEKVLVINRVSLVKLNPKLQGADFKLPK
jgi:hypothetical protein